MKTCPECGCELVENARFCRNCGAEVETIKQGNVCPECGSEISDGARFCAKCGCEIKSEKSNSDNVVHCINCGEEINGNVKFCPNCGMSPTGEVKSGPEVNVVRSTKSPLFALILSFFITGLGQIYLGLTKKGILLLILMFISFVLTLIYIGSILAFILWLYSMYDAYQSAVKINNGEKVEDSLF